MSNSSMQHKKIAGALVAAFGLLAVAPAAVAAPSLQANDLISLGNGPGGNGGGAFNASVLSGAAMGASFQTFCLEYNEYFNSYGQTLRVQAVNTGAVNGGVAGQTSANFDPVSAQTAYLYTNFSKHTLSGNDGGYDYWTGSQETAPTAATNDGTALQLAFWILENEIAYNVANASTITRNQQAQNLYRSYFDASGNAKAGLGVNDLLIANQTKSWLTEANGVVSGGQWSGIGNVKVLNLEKYDTTANKWTNAQDQLYITPVPEPETYAMLLAGLGLIGFVAKRRRRGIGA